MTWTKLGDDFTESPMMRRISRDARYLRVEGLVWSNRHLTDGAIGFNDLRWISDSTELDLAVKELIAAGFWTTTKDGWQIVDWADEQRLAEDVERTRELTSVRQRRWRQHANGDHSLCDPKYCRTAANPDTSSAVTRLKTRYETPTRPDPTRPDPKGRGGGGDGGSSASLAPGGSLRSAAGSEGAWPRYGRGAVRLRYPGPGAEFMIVLDEDVEPQSTDLELVLGPVRFEHVNIIVRLDLDDGDEADEVRVAHPVRKSFVALMRRLCLALFADVDAVRRKHGCPAKGTDVECFLDRSAVDDGDAELEFTVPSTHVHTWLDLIAFELVRLGPPDLPADPERSPR